jgi:Nif-specific regulatory protein
MADGAEAYLVVRRDDGFGDVFPLNPSQRYTMGRAQTNRIVLKDEVCSREHAEVYYAEGRWRLRDLNSLNGTRINGERLDSEWELSPQDEVHLGRSRLIFVEDIKHLPDLPFLPAPGDSVTIKKRLGQTRFLTPLPPVATKDGEPAAKEAGFRRGLSRDLSLLYRLALDMGAATTYQELVQIVLNGLLEATPADAGAILTQREGRDPRGTLEVTDHRHRDLDNHTYVRVSQFLSNEVQASREALLAVDVAEHPHLQHRESIQEVGAHSLICAPILYGDRFFGLIHLYCTNPQHSLDEEDLEFVLAVARQLGTASNQLYRQASLSKENQSLRDQLKVESELVGKSPALEKIEKQIAMVAGTTATVLIRGESGVGKELVARAIHYSSARREGPFVCLNCAALPESLLESELFGHEKGAFTGATEKKIGKFEAADHGTIFLDEIGELNPSTQAKLLRILEGHTFERLGGHTPIKVDVRVVAATNQPLEQGVAEGSFRRDLFFRLQVVEITVSPLRERKPDVEVLAQHFLKRYVRETGRKVHGFTPAALQKLEEYQWPGNVRELRNVIERAVALGFGPILDASDLWLSSVDLAANASPGKIIYQALSLEEVEKQHIFQTLQHTDWNKSRAAAILQIERSTLDRKIRAYELKP